MAVIGRAASSFISDGDPLSTFGTKRLLVTIISVSVQVKLYVFNIPIRLGSASASNVQEADIVGQSGG